MKKVQFSAVAKKGDLNNMAKFEKEEVCHIVAEEVIKGGSILFYWVKCYIRGSAV